MDGEMRGEKRRWRVMIRLFPDSIGMCMLLRLAAQAQACMINTVKIYCAGGVSVLVADFSLFLLSLLSGPVLLLVAQTC